MMQGQGRSELFFDRGVAHHPDLRHRLAHFIHGLEVAEDVIDEIDIADGRRQFVGLHVLVFGEARKEQRAHGQSGFVHAVGRIGETARVDADEAVFACPRRAGLAVAEAGRKGERTRRQHHLGFEIGGAPFHRPRIDARPVLGLEDHRGASVGAVRAKPGEPTSHCERDQPLIHRPSLSSTCVPGRPGEARRPSWRLDALFRPESARAWQFSTGRPRKFPMRTLLKNNPPSLEVARVICQGLGY